MLRLAAMWTAPRRGLLSAAWGGGEAWRSQLQRLPPAPPLGELHARAERAGAAPLDVLLFAHRAAAAGSHAPELADLLHRARLTRHAAPPAAHHAAVRAFLAAKALPLLLDLLDDRLNYGLFLDDITAALLLDHLYEAGDFDSAARVAGFLAMQEDFEGPISEEFALYSTYKFLKDYKEEVVEPVADPVVSKAVPKSKKKTEEVKIRVAYLKNEFFDDHFDLRDRALVAGKTLAMVSGKESAPLPLNCRLIGWTFYKKYEKATDVAKIIAEKNMLYEETVEILRRRADSAAEDSEERRSANAILALLENTVPQKVDVEGDIKIRIKAAIDEHEEEHIARHTKLLNEWEAERDANLENQLEMLEQLELEKRHEARDRELAQIEEKIWYFDNEDAVDLKIEHKNALAAETALSNKRWIVEELKDKYIPPEVQRRKKMNPTNDR